MKISIQERKGIPYAKVPGRSVRRDGKVVKEGVVYLGRVIDAENNVFFSQERGIFTYDPDTGVFGSADESYISDLKDDGRKKQRLILDFGDAFFLDSLLCQSGYNTVLESIKYGNRDTLFSMALYYILCHTANDHAKIWYEGSYASAAYPKANLTSQRITDFLSALGRPENRLAYFDAHVAWVKSICDDPATLIDSTGIPNSIHFPLTAVSNHNGKVSREIRMTVLLQRDTGYPLLFRVTPGNIVDLSTVTRTVNELFMRGMAVDFVAMDAGYFTGENIDELYSLGIDFITRLAPNLTLYKDIVREHAASLRRQENLVQYKDRYVYLKRVDCRLGTKAHEAFVYLGYDIDRGSDEAHKALRRARKNKGSLSSLHNGLEQSGLFMLVSSLPFETDGILPAYYSRQMIEQYFDISKGSAKLTPLRVHSEEALYGHLILSMVAATMNVYIQNKTNCIYSNRDEIFMTLRNQKCMLFKSRLTTTEPQAAANKFYRTFGIECPLYLEQSKDGLVPYYHLSKGAAEPTV